MISLGRSEKEVCPRLSLLVIGPLLVMVPFGAIQRVLILLVTDSMLEKSVKIDFSLIGRASDGDGSGWGWLMIRKKKEILERKNSFIDDFFFINLTRIRAKLRPMPDLKYILEDWGSWALAPALKLQSLRP